MKKSGEVILGIHPNLEQFNKNLVSLNLRLNVEVGNKQKREGVAKTTTHKSKVKNQ